MAFDDDHCSHTLTADVAWAAYRPFVAASTLPARLLARSPRARLRALARSQQRFPFNPPGWRHDPAGGDGSAVDITYCPIAACLLSHGAGGLCVAAWCGQDGPVAERWGVQLRRTGTLATGARACDLRYDTTNRVGVLRRTSLHLGGVRPSTQTSIRRHAGLQVTAPGGAELVGGLCPVNTKMRGTSRNG